MLETFLTLTDCQSDFFGILRQIESRFVDSQIGIFTPLTPLPPKVVPWRKTAFWSEYYVLQT